MQGLLNHCRLRHQVEYGSHDECVQSCAVLVPDAEREWVVANGVEVGGMSLPSLKTLFEIAVGAGDQVKLSSLAKQAQPAAIVKTEPKEQQEVPSPAEVVQEERLSEPPAQSSAHVTRTLGYHADTPALAPFLGRAPKQRCINVRANEDDLIDIERDAGLPSRRTWRKPYTHRNVARPILVEARLSMGRDASPAEESKTDDQHPGDASGGIVPKKIPVEHMLSMTRFHIAARVQVADYSLCMPPS